MEIKTNNASRPLICFEELTAKEAKDFDYIEGEDRFSARLFRYKSVVYDVQEFSRIVRRDGPRRMTDISADDGSPLLKWDFAQSDSHFSGVVFRWYRGDGCKDYDRVVVGTWMS